MSTSSAGGQAGQFGANEWLVEEMYQRFLDDPAALDPVWRDFFADYQPADTGGDVTVGPAGAGVPVGPAGGAIVVSGPAEAVEAPKAGATTGPEAGGRTVADAAGPAPSRPTSKKPVEGSTSRPARPAVTTGQGRRSPLRGAASAVSLWRVELTHWCPVDCMSGCPWVPAQPPWPGAPRSAPPSREQHSATALPTRAGSASHRRRARL